MSLVVDIEKTLPGFTLRMAFTAERETLALLGASGSGKSMTLKSIAGIVTPDRGRIEVDGRVLFDSDSHINLPPQQRRVGYLFQQYALFPHMTARQNLLCGVRGDKKGAGAKADAMLATLGLTAAAEKLPSQLSGGEQQRIALGRILLNEPDILLLDEPFSALDEYLKWQLELELAQTLDQYGGDAILVTHSREEVCRLAKSVCVLDRGRSEPLRDTAALMTAPGTLAAARLSGCQNLSPVTCLPDGRLRCEDWGWILPAVPVPRGLTHVGIRASGLRPGPGRISLSCTVERVIPNLFSGIVILNTPGAKRLRMELPPGTEPPRPASPHREEAAADEGDRRDADAAAWAAIPAAGTALTVHAAPEDLLLLTGGDAP